MKYRRLICRLLEFKFQPNPALTVETAAKSRSLIMLTGWVTLCTLTLLNQGCSHFMEARAIQQFASALQEANYEELLATTSAEFEDKALRQKDAVEDFKLLRFPKGKTSIDNVEDVSDTEKEVTVSIKGSKRKLRYHLVKKEETGKWVVDDVLIRQTKDGAKVTKSVTEQMNLLLAVREFMSAWQSQNRQRALSILTPSFEEQLTSLPDSYLFYLTSRAVGTSADVSKFKPEAQLDDGVAVVKLPRKTGVMVISCKQVNDDWKIDDLAVESKGDKNHINSVRKLANVVSASTHFLTAWHASDHNQLQKLATKKFYEGSLAPADLTMVEIPHIDNPADDIKINILKHRADFILEEKGSLYKVSLKQVKQEKSQSADRYLIDDITIFNLKNGEEKRLSALFTTHAIIRIFADAIDQKNLDLLKKTSTTDFNRRVWNKLSDEALPLFPLHELGLGTPEILTTDFQGAITNVTVKRGRNSYLYVMRDRGGELRVDDIQLKLKNRPASFKTTLELIMPVVQFAEAIRASRVDLVQRTVSDDFNRLIWRQLRGVPSMVHAVPTYLQMPITAIESSTDKHVIQLGDAQRGAQVAVLSEKNELVVDDVEIIAGVEPEKHAHLKQTLRSKIATGTLHFPEKSYATTTADFTQPADKRPGRRGAHSTGALRKSLQSGVERDSLSAEELLQELQMDSRAGSHTSDVQPADFRQQTTFKQPPRRLPGGQKSFRGLKSISGNRRPSLKQHKSQAEAPQFLDPPLPAGLSPGDIVITPDPQPVKQYENFPPLTQ